MPFRRKGKKVVDSSQEGGGPRSTGGDGSDAGPTEGPSPAAASGRRNQQSGAQGTAGTPSAYEQPTRKAPSRADNGTGRRTRGDDAETGARRPRRDTDDGPGGDVEEIPDESHQQERARSEGAPTKDVDSSAREASGSTSGAGQDGEARTQILRGAKRGRQSAPAQADAGSGVDGTDSSGDQVEDPPAGWLVVVHGPGKGRAVQVGIGANQIGSDPNQRIPVDFGDAAISRESHALLVYDPNSRQFFINHGSGKNLTYVNGELIMTPTELQAHSEIQLGDTVFRFLPLCGEQFDWSETE